jgi:hypothetical protein
VGSIAYRGPEQGELCHAESMHQFGFVYRLTDILPSLYL